jgi:DNA repair protein RecN (Recombination protein N)
MLKLLRINNIAIISELELEFGSGLSLLTGETGAGKSILIDALGLLFGARASAELIRTGEERAVVEAVFESAGAARAGEAHGLPVDGEELVLRREVHSSGKGKATVNGALVPVSVLRELAPWLAAIHGQHEPQGLLDPETHIAVLDRHAGLADEAEALAGPFRRLREVEAELDALRRDRREAERRREMLDYQAAEIEKAHLAAGEEEALRQEKQIQASAGRLAELSSDAYRLLYDDEDAVVSRLGQIYRKVEELAAIDPRLAPHLEAKAAVRASLDDLALFLRDYREGLQVSPGRLDEIESRLDLVERLKRKYGATVEEVIAFGARCRADLASLGSPEEREAALQREKEDLAGKYLAAARALSRKRRSAARDLEKKMQSELAELAMEKTRFKVQFQPDVAGDERSAIHSRVARGGLGGAPLAPPSSIEDDDGAVWTEQGLETAEFLISPNPGEELRGLARIASGGELSRILLALKSVATEDDPEEGKTLVFDEVDAGIGGRVAEVVGRKLRAIAERHQVLCVTHLPQIASMADSHFVVRKRVERGRTITDVRPLADAERVEEVARMLGGETITETARRHAREMVKQGVRA